MKKRYIIGLILCCLMIVPLLGCTKKVATTTPTGQTPLQLLSARVNATDAKDITQDSSLFSLSNRITAVENRPVIDEGGILARLGVLEGFNISDITGDLSFLTVRVTSLESYNISARLASIEARLNASATPTPTPTPNGSTPTPTPTATPIPTPPLNCSTITKPVAVFPLNGNMSVSNSTIMFQWSNCNASSYDFYFGNNSNTMSLIANTTDIPMYLKNSEILPDTYYFWKVIAISTCGNKSSSWWFKTE